MAPSGARASVQWLIHLFGHGMTVNAILFDIDGTLMLRGEAIAGAAAAVDDARRRGLQIRFLTNTTARSPAALGTQLCQHGIQASADEIQTAATVGLSMLAARPDARCHLMLPPSVIGLFDGVIRDDHAPDLVVIGDLGDEFSYAGLNQALRMLRAGAGLIALQKNLYWFADDGARLDCGAFVLALEAASGVKAEVAGKPSPHFFETALAGLACVREQVLIVGDDIDTDIAGGNAAGVPTVLVRTGKFADRMRNGVSVSTGPASHVIDSVGDLPRLLDQLI